MPHAHRSLLTVLSAIFLLAASAASVAADRPYKEGPVYEITAIRTVDGGFDDYMAWLAGPWKQMMEEQKKAGIIMDYEVNLAFPRGPKDPDLYLVTVYKNFAALDDLEARSEPVMEKVLGNRQKASADSVARGKIRTVLGSEIVRKLELK